MGINTPLRAGDRVTAVAGTTSAIWSEGTVGVVAEVRDHKPYSGNDSKNLVRWDEGRGILMGFRHSEVVRAEESQDGTQ